MHVQQIRGHLQSDDIFKDINLLNDDAKKFNTVHQKFEDYFCARKNVIFECAKFNTKSLGSSELDESVCYVFV